MFATTVTRGKDCNSSFQTFSSLILKRTTDERMYRFTYSISYTKKSSFKKKSYFSESFIFFNNMKFPLSQLYYVGGNYIYRKTRKPKCRWV